MGVMVSRRRGLTIAGLTAAGQTSREIAQRVYITQKTVEGHLARVFRKLRTDSRAQLPAALSREQGCRQQRRQEPDPMATRRRERRVLPRGVPRHTAVPAIAP